jgi:hypothetical protein
MSPSQSAECRDMYEESTRWRHFLMMFLHKAFESLISNSEPRWFVYFFIFSPLQAHEWMENAEDYQPFSKVFYDCSLLRISINPFHIAPVYLPLNLMLLETWSLLSRTDFFLYHVPSQRFSIKYDTWTSERNEGKRDESEP